MVLCVRLSTPGSRPILCLFLDTRRHPLRHLCTGQATGFRRSPLFADTVADRPTSRGADVANANRRLGVQDVGEILKRAKPAE
jgi:hypothetical protein